MMNKFLILIIGLILSSNIQAQSISNAKPSYGTTSLTNLYDLVDPHQQNVNIYYGKKDSQVKGTPFFSKEWHNGYVVLNDSSKFTNQEIKFDVINDDLWLRKVDEKVIIVNKNDVSYFGWEQEGKQIVFQKCFLDFKARYLEVIYKDDHFQVFKKYNKKFVATNASASNPYNSDAKDSFSWGKARLYYINDNQYVPLSSKSKEFYKIFGALDKPMYKYAKEENLKRKDKEDLEKIFTHYNVISK